MPIKSHGMPQWNIQLFLFTCKPPTMMHKTHWTDSLAFVLLLHCHTGLLCFLYLFVYLNVFYGLLSWVEQRKTDWISPRMNKVIGMWNHCNCLSMCTNHRCPPVSQTVSRRWFYSQLSWIALLVVNWILIKEFNFHSYPPCLWILEDTSLGWRALQFN